MTGRGLSTDSKAPLRRFVLDASVLINFLLVARLDLLERLPGFAFLVPEEVAAEITRPAQRELLSKRLGSPALRAVRVEGVQELALFAEFRMRWGRGESACLAIAQERGFGVACDERGGFLKLLRHRIGDARITNTPGLLLSAIRAGLLDIPEADRLKDQLEGLRFRMAFASFRDRLPGSGTP